MDDNAKKVKEWIFHARKDGMSDREIEDAMIQRGYSRSHIAALLKEFPRHSKWLKWAVPIAIILIAAAVIFMIFPAKTCQTDSCFIDLANQCKNVKMEKVIAGSLYGFSEKDCILEKTAKKMNETEPMAIVTLFESASMECPYAKGSFDERLLNTLSLGIENCEGDLKESIQALLESV